MTSCLRERKEAEAQALDNALTALARQRQRTRHRGRWIRDVLEARGAGEWNGLPEPAPSIAAACRLCTDRTTREAFTMLTTLVEQRAARLLDEPYGSDPHRYVHGLQRLAVHWRKWRKPLENWRPTSHNPVRQFSQLARYLLAEYRVPAFMDSVFLVRTPLVNDGWFAHVGMGGSLRTADGLPIPLTKRMAHCTLEAPENLDIVQALRWGQTLGLGGDPRLARALNATLLGRTLYSPETEAWWVTVIQWFVNHPMLDTTQVGPIVDYVQARYFGDPARGLRPEPGFSMKGRAPAAVLRLIEEWHRELNAARAVALEARRWKPQERYRPCGVRAGTWSFGKDERRRTWTVREILTHAALVDEGRAMRHCVVSYARSIEQGVCSIWSLQTARAGGGPAARAVTIEVLNGPREIVQVRGACNRDPTDEERRILDLWAVENRLTLEL